MNALLGLLAGGQGVIAAVGAAIALLIGGFVAGSRSAKNRERAKNLKDDLNDYEEIDRRAAQGERVRRDSERQSHADLLRDDGHKRP